METILKGAASEIVIGPKRPLVLIGNRIDAGAGTQVAQAIRELDLARIETEARRQADEGADVIAVRACGPGVDQERVLPALVEAVSRAVPLPICLRTENVRALEAALRVCPGKPLVDSVNGKSVALNELLPMCAAHRVAVLATALDGEGIPKDLDDRIALMRNTLRVAILSGIPREDVVLNPTCLPVSVDAGAAEVCLKAMAYLARIEQLNVALEPALAVEGVESPHTVGQVLVALAVGSGATCVLADPAEYSSTLRSADLLSGRRGFTR